MKTRHLSLNLQAAAGDIQQPAAELPIPPAENSLEQLQCSMLQAHLQLESLIYAYEAHVRKTHVLWALVIFLSAGMLAGAGFAYTYMSDSQSAGVERPAAPLLSSQPAAEMTARALAAMQSDQGESTRRIAELELEVAALHSQLQGRSDPKPPPALPGQPVRKDVAAGIAPPKAPPVAGMRRVNFQIPRNRTEQIAPDVYLTIKEDTGTGAQVDGWMQLARDRRIVWIRELALETPLDFTTRQEPRTHHLVLTRITDAAVSGYLLLPGPVTSASVIPR
jgi:hypothetical protein